MIQESGINCGFQRKRAFLYSSFPPTPVLSSLSSAVRRKRVFLPTVPGRLEVGAGRRRGLAGKGITATVSAIHAKHGSGRDKNWRKNLIFSDMIEKHFHKCQPLPITSKAFGYKKGIEFVPFNAVFVFICVFTFICAFVIVCICHHLNCHRHFADPSLSASVAQPKANSRLDRRLLPPHRLEDHPHSQTYSWSASPPMLKIRPFLKLFFSSLLDPDHDGVWPCSPCRVSAGNNTILFCHNI